MKNFYVFILFFCIFSCTNEVEKSIEQSAKIKLDSTVTDSVLVNKVDSLSSDSTQDAKTDTLDN